jgi:hypothetical protein
MLVLTLIFLALLSPFVAVGVLWALCVKRRRHIGVFAAKIGILSGAGFIAAYLGLSAVQDEPVPLMTLGIAGGAGFTIGVLLVLALAWVGAQRWNSAAPDDAYAGTPVYSPDRQYMAILFTQSGGGAMAPYCFSKVSVAPASVLPADAYARKFRVYEGYCHSLGFKYRPNRPPVMESAPLLEWRGPHELNITFDPKQAPLGIKKFLFIDHADNGRVKIIPQHFQR